jgi:hypothetical protein
MAGKHSARLESQLWQLWQAANDLYCAKKGAAARDIAYWMWASFGETYKVKQIAFHLMCKYDRRENLNRGAWLPLAQRPKVRAALKEIL